MKVQSTGLGKTVMVAHFKGLSISEFYNQKAMEMIIESTEPLHWHIKVYMEPKDVRRAVIIGMKPSIIWKGLTALIFGRFSLFSRRRAEEESVEKEPSEIEQPKAPPEEPAKKDDRAVSPLAKLKG